MTSLPKIWLNLEPHPAVYEVLDGRAEIVGPLVQPDKEDPLTDIELAHGVLVSTDFPANRETFERAKNLKVVARYGIGLDSVDVEAATDCGICVVHTPDAPTVSVSELTIALIIGVLRKVIVMDRVIRAGGWNSKALISHELCGKKVGLIGCGRIGSRVAKLLHAFEAKVTAFDPYVSPDVIKKLGAIPADSLESLLRDIDVISLHLPLTDETRGLLGRDEFSLMKPEAVLINVSRGPIIVESELFQALQDGKIAGAGLDVFEKEPTSEDNPLFSLENVMLAPHAGGFTWEAKGRSNPGAAEQALQVINGNRPPFLANPEVWENRRR